MMRHPNEPVLPLTRRTWLAPSGVHMDRPDGHDRHSRWRPALPKRGSLCRDPSADRPWRRSRPTPMHSIRRELRILAGAKLWTTVDSFFAYPDLMDQPWETHCRRSSEDGEGPERHQYVLSLAEVGTWLCATDMSTCADTPSSSGSSASTRRSG